MWIEFPKLTTFMSGRHVFNPTELAVRRPAADTDADSVADAKDAQFQPYARMEDVDDNNDMKRRTNLLSVPTPSYNTVFFGGLRARSRSPAGDRKAIP